MEIICAKLDDRIRDVRFDLIESYALVSKTEKLFFCCLNDALSHMRKIENKMVLIDNEGNEYNIAGEVIQKHEILEAKGYIVISNNVLLQSGIKEHEIEDFMQKYKYYINFQFPYMQARIHNSHLKVNRITVFSNCFADQISDQVSDLTRRFIEQRK